MTAASPATARNRQTWHTVGRVDPQSGAMLFIAPSGRTTTSAYDALAAHDADHAARLARDCYPPGEWFAVTIPAGCVAMLPP